MSNFFFCRHVFKKPSAAEVSENVYMRESVNKLCNYIQEQREDMLRTLMLKKTAISEDSMDNLDLSALSQRMQGFVARDLESIVNRAVHAHILNQGRG